MFRCMECGKKFRTVRAAERASSNGCPKCGGCDIDLDVEAGCRGHETTTGPIGATTYCDGTCRRAEVTAEQT